MAGNTGNLPPINFAALADALLRQSASFVEGLLPEGQQRGHEYICGSLSGGKGTSCSVNLTTGRWSDFATGEAGNDLIGLYAAVHGLPMAKAAIQLAREYGLEDVAGLVHKSGAQQPAKPLPLPTPSPAAKKPTTPAVQDRWRALAVVPTDAPAVTYKHQFRGPESITHVATYRSEAGLHGYVVRFATSDGGKDTMPRTWCTSEVDGGSRWHWKQFSDPRPLYLPGGLTPAAVLAATAHRPSVVLVEGERKADLLHQLLEASFNDGLCGRYLVASWPGGCRAWAKADWSWLAGCEVLCWPDCDAHRVPLTKAEREACANDAGRDIAAAAKPLLPEHKQPGMSAMLGIGALLIESHGCQVRVCAIPEPGVVKAGWDCADAIEHDGWELHKILSLFDGAKPMPDQVGADAKKIDGLVGTKGDDSPGGADPALAGDSEAEGRTANGRKVPWWLWPFWDGEKGRWGVSRKLVIKALENDEALADVLAYNELSNTVQSRIQWPWVHAQTGDVEDADDLMLGKYLSDTYGLPSIARAALSEAIQTVAHTRRFHPVREYLAGIEWDGKTRLDGWLIYALGETPDTLGPAMTEYFGLVGRFWLLGMVYRVMEPGCKFDYCPVLEGVGGLRKSTLVETLAGKPYFSDTPFEVGRGKEAQEQVQGLWLYEIAEMSNFSRAEVGAIKAFISSKVDRYRVAYGATVGSFKRQCLLVGTTNENTYLRDRTGNRRFWPVPVKHVIKTDWVEKYRSQLFAEAYQAYLQAQRYTPTPEEERRLFVPMQESRLVETAVQSELLHLLTRAPLQGGVGAIVHVGAEFVTISQLVLALGVDAAKSGPALEAQVRGWLDYEGWQRVKRQINGVRAWGYERPSQWPVDGNETDLQPRAADAGPLNEGDDDAPF